MDRRQAYEIEVLATFARMGRRAPEISDTDRDNEFRAQQTFFAALDVFKSEVQSAARLSELRKDALSELLDTLSDTTPDAMAWDEAMAERRNGY